MDRINPQAYAIVAALWLTAGLSNAQGQTVDVAAAKKDTKVVVYGTVVPQAMEELHRTSKKSTTSRSNTGAVLPRRSPSAPRASGAPGGRLSTSSNRVGTS